MSFLSSLLDILFPPKCVFCGRVLSVPDAGLCEKCMVTLPYTTDDDALISGESFELCCSPLRYIGDVRKSILKYKFKGAAQYADTYGGLLAACIQTRLPGRYDMISWVPLSVKRLKTRGYDQAMLLALAAALNLDDVAVETLQKTVDVRAQSSLKDRESRKSNIGGAYIVADPELIAGHRILLIDDIVTTGATLSECARTLLDAGAVSVVCCALARA